MRLAALLLGSVAPLRATRASAQVTSQPAALLAVLARLGGLGTTAPLPDPLCPGASGSLERACAGFAAARRAELGQGAAEAIKARDLFERVVQDEPTWPVAWYGLGVARVQAARAGVIARSGPRHPIGVSNEAGAANAFLHALELDSTFVLAADALARAPLGREGLSRGKERLPLLRKAYWMLPPPAIHSAALLEYQGGSADTAVAWLEALRRSGKFPVGLTDHLLAKAYFRIGKPDAGRTAFLRGVEDTLAISQATYRQELAWIATPGELAAWDSIPAGTRAPWMREFWARRDIEGGHAPGERIAEHLRRLAYVLEHYAVTLPQSGKNRAPGVAVTIDPYPEQALFQFFKEQPFFSGDVEAARELNDAASAVSRLESDRRVLGGDQAFRLLSSSTELLDDRGVMYLRHGAPDKMAKTVGGEAVELWLYDLPAGPRFLAFKEVNFDGQVGASQLVPTLLSTSVVVRNQVCHLKPSICTADADPRGSTVSMGIAQGKPCSPTSIPPCYTMEDRMASATGVRIEGTQRVFDEAKRQSSGTQIRRDRQEGEATISELSTTDQYRPTFTAPLDPRIQLVSLRNPDAGTRHAVAAVAVPGTGLLPLDGVFTDGRVAYRLRLQLQAVRRSDGLRVDLDTMRTFTSAKPLTAGEFLTMVVALPLQPGTYTASIRISQEDGRGAVAVLSRLEVPASSRALGVSDLVLGREKSGARWRYPGGDVLLNPLNAFGRTEVATLYFQLTGLSVGESYTHRIELYRRDDPPEAKPRLGIEFVHKATEDHAEQEKDLNLAQLEPGVYRLRLVVTHGASTTEAVSWLTVVK